mmetsp:Transcript_49673/g.94931  ORF Transcript_49673/g.94931 Transcript_49673/m.94931 type:complete len:241 (+) Transcript_49673:764-1486(+)
MRDSFSWPVSWVGNLRQTSPSAVSETMAGTGDGSANTGSTNRLSSSSWLGMGVVEAAREGGALVSAVGEHASPSAERRSSHWEKSMRSVCSPRFTLSSSVAPATLRSRAYISAEKQDAGSSVTATQPRRVSTANHDAMLTTSLSSFSLASKLASPYRAATSPLVISHRASSPVQNLIKTCRRLLSTAWRTILGLPKMTAATRLGAHTWSELRCEECARLSAPLAASAPSSSVSASTSATH